MRNPIIIRYCKFLATAFLMFSCMLSVPDVTDAAAVPTQRESLLRFAKSQVGSSNTAALKYVGIPKGSEWCASFVSYCAHGAGIKDYSTYKGGKVTYVPDIMAYYYKKGALHDYDEKNYTPKPGDLIFFDWKGCCHNYHNACVKGHRTHVGIVERVTASGKIYTIEGNRSHSTKVQDNLTASSKYIIAFASLDDWYDLKDISTYLSYPGSALKSGSADSYVPYIRFIQDAINVLGFQVTASGSFDTATENAVKLIQANDTLSQDKSYNAADDGDGVIGPNTWKLIVDGLKTAAPSSGTCGADGDNLTWSYDGNGTLIISGHGKMADYAMSQMHPGSSYNYRPWPHYRIRKIILPDGITSIGNAAFRDFTRLESINLPTGILSVGDSAFENCHSLSKIVLPDSINYIGGHAFYNCTNLKSVRFPKQSSWLNDSYANRPYFYDIFAGCKELTEMYVREGLRNVPARMFYGCSNLVTVYLPGTLEAIGQQAFQSCSSLKKIVFNGSSDQWKKISGTSAIRKGIKIEYARGIAVGKTAVSSGITYKAVSTTEVVVKKGSDKSTVKIPATVRLNKLQYKVIGIQKNAFKLCGKLKTLSIGSNVDTIGANAFKQCEKLNKITFNGKGLRTIEASAFSGCTSLKEVSLPKSLHRIGTKAFYNCSSLKKIRITYTEDDGTILGLGKNAFNKTASNVTFYLPKSKYDYYKFQITKSGVPKGAVYKKK